MVAYCLYKEQKKKFIENLTHRYKKISRRSRRVEAFHKDFVNKDQISTFRDAAEYRLSAYIKEFADEAKGEAYREIAVDRDHGQLSNAPTGKSKTINNWIIGVSTSMTATLIIGVFVDLDEYFPAVDPFPDHTEQQAKAPPDIDPGVFRIEPAAPPRQSNLPVM